MNTIKKKMVAALHKEFKKLEKGKTVRVKFKLTQDIDIPLKVYWESDDYSNYSWDEKLVNKYTDQVFMEIEESCINESSNYTQEIRKFIDKCDGFALQFGQDKNSFWNEVYTFGREAESKKIAKRNLKKEIADTEIKLNALQQKLCNLKSSIIKT